MWVGLYAYSPTPCWDFFSVLSSWSSYTCCHSLCPFIYAPLSCVWKFPWSHPPPPIPLRKIYIFRSLWFTGSEHNGKYKRNFLAQSSPPISLKPLEPGQPTWLHVSCCLHGFFDVWSPSGSCFLAECLHFHSHIHPITSSILDRNLSSDWQSRLIEEFITRIITRIPQRHASKGSKRCEVWKNTPGMSSLSLLLYIFYRFSIWIWEWVQRAIKELLSIQSQSKFSVIASLHRNLMLPPET